VRIVWIVGLVLLAVAGACGSQLESAKQDVEDSVELALYPSGRYLRLLSLGQPTLLADIAWLQAIQYYGKHRKEDRQYPYAEHLFDIITAADPDFRNAYLFGALVLEDKDGSLEAATQLLTQGLRANPDDWMLTFHRGFLEYLRGDAAIGAVEMGRAARLPNAPPYTARLAAHACGRTGSTMLALQIWEEIARATADPAIKRLAEERVAELTEQIRARAGESEGR
jgi:hypothetical protein